MGAGEILRYVYPTRTARGNEARSPRLDHPALPERPIAAELEHEPAHLRLLSPGQLHLDKSHSAAWRHHSDRHAERRRADQIGGSAGGADFRIVAAWLYR